MWKKDVRRWKQRSNRRERNAGQTMKQNFPANNLDIWVIRLISVTTVSLNESNTGFPRGVRDLTADHAMLGRLPGPLQLERQQSQFVFECYGIRTRILLAMG